MHDKIITDEDLKNNFEKFSQEMQNNNSESKLNISVQMIELISMYLRQEVKNIDTTALLLLLEEVADISRGNEPEFIKSYKRKIGRPVKLGLNIRFASLVASIEIMIANKTNVNEAIKKVSDLSGYKINRLKQIRKEFRENKRPEIAIDFMRKQIKKQKDLGLNPEAFVISLIELGTQKGG